MGTGYNLNADQVKQAMQEGEKEAAAIISKGPKATNDLFHFWSLKR